MRSRLLPAWQQKPNLRHSYLQTRPLQLPRQPQHPSLQQRQQSPSQPLQLLSPQLAFLLLFLPSLLLHKCPLQPLSLLLPWPLQHLQCMLRQLLL